MIDSGGAVGPVYCRECEAVRHAGWSALKTRGLSKHKGTVDPAHEASRANKSSRMIRVGYAPSYGVAGMCVSVRVSSQLTERHRKPCAG